MNIHKILLPLDLLESSPPVALIREAAELGHHFRAEIQIIHVVKPFTYIARADTAHEMLEQDLIRQQQKLEELVGPELMGLAIRNVVLKGDPAREILQWAHNEKIDLIVMPTHGYGTLERLLLGSVTNKVLHQSECPVWTCTLSQKPPGQKIAIHKVLCAIDFSPHSAELLRAAQDVADEFGSKLVLTHVTPSVEIYGPGGYYVLEEMKEALVGSANKQMETLQREVGTNAEVVIRSGDVARKLHEVAGETKADLLMIRSRARGARLGTHGYGIIRESPIPVLSI